MSKEQAKDELIDLLYSQVVDLSMMSKIELGDDVIAQIILLRNIITDDDSPEYKSWWDTFLYGSIVGIFAGITIGFWMCNF